MQARALIRAQMEKRLEKKPQLIEQSMSHVFRLIDDATHIKYSSGP